MPKQAVGFVGGSPGQQMCNQVQTHGWKHEYRKKQMDKWKYINVHYLCWITLSKKKQSDRAGRFFESIAPKKAGHWAVFWDCGFQTQISRVVGSKVPLVNVYINSNIIYS